VKVCLYPAKKSLFSQKKTPRENIPLVSSGLCFVASQVTHLAFWQASSNKMAVFSPTDAQNILL
jgi:hypothetical protein